jgi:hypothetical protein
MKITEYKSPMEITTLAVDNDFKDMFLEYSEKETKRFFKEIESGLIVQEYKGKDYEYDKYDIDLIGIQGVKINLKTKK